MEKRGRWWGQQVVFSSEATLQLFMSAQLSVYPSVRMSVCLLGLGGNVIFSAPY